MSIVLREKPKFQEASVDRKNPKTTREYGIDGSTSKTDILLYLAANTPNTDTVVDFETSAAITVFRNNIDLKEFAGGCWDATIHYESSPSTIDITFTHGVQNVKIVQAIRSIRTYNCRNPVSGGTEALATAASEAGEEASELAAALSAFIDALTLAITTAVSANAVVGVDPTVSAPVAIAISEGNSAKAFAITARSAVGIAGVAAQAAAVAAMAPQAAEANTQATIAENAASDAATAYGIAQTDANDAGDAAADAQAAASLVVSPENTAAADAATNVATTAQDLMIELLAASIAATAAGDAARAAADSAGTETDIGVTVPSVHRAIGVNGNDVEGVDIEKGVVEFTVTKRWARASLSANYVQEITEFQANPLGTPVNHAIFVLVWLGQTLVFPAKSLRCRTINIRSTSGAELEIGYNFAFSRGILLSDNFRVGNSVAITQGPWEYGWARFEQVVSAGRVVSTAASYHVDQVYPEDDFGILEL